MVIIEHKRLLIGRNNKGHLVGQGRQIKLNEWSLQRCAELLVAEAGSAAAAAAA